jgi:hypothetical protein
MIIYCIPPWLSVSPQANTSRLTVSSPVVGKTKFPPGPVITGMGMWIIPAVAQNANDVPHRMVKSMTAGGIYFFSSLPRDIELQRPISAACLMYPLVLFH